MHIYPLLFTYCVLILIWIITFIIQTNFLFLFIIINNNRLFYHFVNILGKNSIGVEGAKTLADALKLNKNLTNIDLCRFLLLFSHIIT